MSIQLIASYQEQKFIQMDSNDEYMKTDRPLCKDTIHCLAQYSNEESAQHNQRYCHPCRFSELCRMKNDVSHCKQFIHIETRAIPCRYGRECRDIIDPIHRYKYRHPNLPDLLYPCRRSQCDNKSFEHRKRYSHREKIHIKLPSGGETQQRKEESSSTWSVDLNDGQDDDNNVNILNFYNADFGKSKIPDAASFDQYGNPKGTNYDLGKDGAFNNYSILIAQFYQDSQFDDKAMQVPIDTLKAKGFQVSHVKNEQECIRELKTNRYAVAWIISTASITQHDFISALTTFHHEGGALFLFADNVPYICHASEFLKLKFGITLDGSYMGYKTLTFIENGHQQLGHFGQHDIFTGIENLFEGVTICHPIYPSETIKRQFLNLATATDGNPTIGVYDPISGSNEGRLALDCGFTKLYINWDSAGTARYIVNVSCWLLGIDKRLNQTKTRR